MNLSHKIQDDIFNPLAEVATNENIKTYVIGGYVRDLLLERKHKKDIDFVVLGDGISFAKKVAARLNKEKFLSVFKNFGTAMIHYKGEGLGARVCRG